MALHQDRRGGRAGPLIIVDPSAKYMTAMEAWRRFGKGNHPAQLNLGDCYSHALAGVRGVPLLFVGSDFTQTDIIAA